MQLAREDGCNVMEAAACFYISKMYNNVICVVGPCHHGMARPQVADRGTASNMEGSCE